MGLKNKKKVLGAKMHLGYYKPSVLENHRKRIPKYDLPLSLSWSAKSLLSYHRKRKSRNR